MNPIIEAVAAGLEVQAKELDKAAMRLRDQAALLRNENRLSD